MKLESIQIYFDEVMNRQNNQAIPEFEGYSPYEMHQILHFTFGPNSPLHLEILSESEYLSMPLIRQVKFFLELIATSGDLKLTQQGFLTTKVVQEIYAQEFIEPMGDSTMVSQRYRESDSMTVHLTRLLCELSGLIKKRNNRISLTKKAEKALSDIRQLFELIWNTITSKFNWAYFDGYGDNQVGQLGFGFSLILLSKYGGTKHLDKFYAEKYFKAFPNFLELEARTNYRSPLDYYTSCYCIRTFDRFMKYFGLIEIDSVGEKWEMEDYITRTVLFDKLLKINPHKGMDE